MGNSEFCGTFPPVSGLGLDSLNDVQVESTLAMEFALDVGRSLILAIHPIFTTFKEIFSTIKEHANRMQENFERLHDTTTSGFQVCD
jgi:hypothetical protein